MKLPTVLAVSFIGLLLLLIPTSTQYQNAKLTGISFQPQNLNMKQLWTCSDEQNCIVQEKSAISICSNISFINFSTYLGGSSDEYCTDIAVDEFGYVYVTGYTVSPDFPTINAFDDSYNGGAWGDAFITKFSTDGNTIIYSTYFGGTGSDGATSITVDSEGNAYITGDTGSHDFPTTENAFQGQFAGGVTDAFVAKFSPCGELLYSTYLGGTTSQRYEEGFGITTDPSGCIYVTGSTCSDDFPTINAYDDTYNMGENPYYDAFITKISADGCTLIYSTYLGGTYTDRGFGIVIDNEENAYVTGIVWSSDFPTTENAYDNSLDGDIDAFVVQLSSAGKILLYSSFLGGSDLDYGTGISIDSFDAIYITGSTCSDDFPTLNAYDNILNDGFYTHFDVFVTKFCPEGDALMYSTYLGGWEYDEAFDISVDSDGSVYITGYTASDDFPTVNAFQKEGHWTGNGPEGFITRFSPCGASILFSTYLGGSACEAGYPYFDAAITLDSFENFYVAGPTNSIDFPTTENAYDSSYNGACDGFIVKFYRLDIHYEKCFLIGRIKNYKDGEDTVSFEAVNVYCVCFSPFRINSYSDGKKITISKNKLGFTGDWFVCAFCGIAR